MLLDSNYPGSKRTRQSLESLQTLLENDFGGDRLGIRVYTRKIQPNSELRNIILVNGRIVNVPNDGLTKHDILMYMILELKRTRSLMKMLKASTSLEGDSLYTATARLSSFTGQLFTSNPHSQRVRIENSESMSEAEGKFHYAWNKESSSNGMVSDLYFGNQCKFF